MAVALVAVSRAGCSVLLGQQPHLASHPGAWVASQSPQPQPRASPGKGAELGTFV